MLAALLAAAALAAPATGTDLTDAQLAGQRVIFAFPGTEPPPKLVARIRRGEAAGVILFGGNVPSVAAGRRVVQRLQAIPRPPGLDAPLFVMIDQEGGAVERIPDPALPSAARLGRSDDTAAARAAGHRAGRDVRSVGGNVNLAPVADVGRAGSAIERETRSFGRDPTRVARLSVAFATGVRDAGVLATAKHFPGFGAAPASTDVTRVRIGLPISTLRAIDERPFAALIRDGVPLVMLGSSVYPALDSRPAALSRRVIANELRGRLGFRGVTVSDALDTPSLAAVGPSDRVAVEAARAGIDLLLYSGFSGGDGAARALHSALRSGRLSRIAARTAVDRILRLRATLPAAHSSG
jgi:beta-N-acetylhexosaminidase